MYMCECVYELMFVYVSVHVVCVCSMCDVVCVWRENGMCVCVICVWYVCHYVCTFPIFL